MIEEFLSDFGIEELNAEKSKVAFFLMMTSVDGHIDETELSFIKEKAKTYGISDREMDKILDLVKKRAAKISTPETETGRVEFIRELAQLVMIDGDIHPKELEYGEKLCDNMGYKKELFGNLVRAEKKRSDYFMAEWEKLKNPTERDYRNIMLDAIKKYPV